MMSVLPLIGCEPRVRDSSNSTNSTTELKRATESRKTSANEVASKAKEALDVTHDFAAQTIDEFSAEVKRRLAVMNQKIHEWEAQSKPLSDDAKARWNEEHELLRERRAKLEQELDRLKEAGGNAWEEMKEGSKAAWNDLADAYRKVASHFEKHEESSRP